MYVILANYQGVLSLGAYKSCRWMDRWDIAQKHTDFTVPSIRFGLNNFLSMYSFPGVLLVTFCVSILSTRSSVKLASLQ